MASLALAVFVVGCASGEILSISPAVPPNTYLPMGPAGGCEEIEVEWHTAMGSKEHSFHSGRNDQCLYLKGLNRQPDPPPIRVRCVTRAPDGLTISGPWVDGVKAESKRAFKELCPAQTGSN
jgi:hypothetical protein